MISIKMPEAILLNDKGAVVGYVSEANDCYGHQVYCYRQDGSLFKMFNAKDALAQGLKTSYEVTRWFRVQLMNEGGQTNETKESHVADSSSNAVNSM